MIRVIHFANMLEPEHEVIESSSFVSALMQIYPVDCAGVPTVPSTLRLYHEHYAEDHELPMNTLEDIDVIEALDGLFILVNTPADPATWTAIGIMQVLAAVATVAAIVLAPDAPVATQRNIQKESPNNGLSGRANRERINARIPDIFGTVRSTPDLLAVPYPEFVNHVEVEVAYMCIGRGTYEVPAAQVREADTRTSEIAGMSVEVYGPNTSPNSGSPQLRIGNAINRPILMTQRLEAVNGQVLQPADTGSVVSRPMVFTSPNTVTLHDDGIDLTDRFIAGEVVTISGAAQLDGNFSFTPPADLPAEISRVSPNNFELTLAGDHTLEWLAGHVLTLSSARFEFNSGGPDDPINTVAVDVSGIYPIISTNMRSGRTVLNLGRANDINGAWNGLSATGIGLPTLTRPSGAVQFDLSGQYVINTITSSELTLNDPSAVNPAWEVMRTLYGGQSRTLVASLLTSGERWVGWFTMSSTKPINQLIANFVALNGMYKDNGRQQYRTDVLVRLEAVPVDEEGNDVGPLYSWEQTVVGTATSRTTRAYTFRVAMDTSSLHWRIRAKRVTPSDTAFTGSVVDEVKWRDLYGAAPVEVPHFGDVTTVQVVTLATDGALAVKDRKLNMQVTRKLPKWLGGKSFTSTLHPTANAADIFSFLALDPYVGNRTVDEIDFDNIYQTVAEVVDYFGFAAAADFCYTFDDNNLSWEETAKAIASTICCEAYRQGSQHRLFFERKNPNSSLLFNHRNKLPGSETRTEEFGTKAENYDGVEFKYIDPADDGPVTLYIPADRSAVNPKPIESIGVRDHRKAHILARRAWNKILYQTTSSEFMALPEANPLILMNRISNADNTLSQSMDGEICGINGLELDMSQPLTWAGDAVIELQGSDGLTEMIPVTKGRSDRHVMLARAPRTPINYEPWQYVKTVFALATDERSPDPFLVSEKGEPDEKGCIPIVAYNYDDRYYQNDKDYAV